MNWKTLALLGAAAAGIAALVFGRRQSAARRQRPIQIPERAASAQPSASARPSPPPASTRAASAPIAMPAAPPPPVAPEPAQPEPPATLPAMPVLEPDEAAAELAEMMAEDAFMEAIEPLDPAAGVALADAVAAARAPGTGEDAGGVETAPDDEALVSAATGMPRAPGERVDSDLTILAGAAPSVLPGAGASSDATAPDTTRPIDQESAAGQEAGGGAPPAGRTPPAPSAVDPLAATMPGAVLPAMERQLAQELLVAAGDDGASLQETAEALSAPAGRSAASYLEEGNVYFNVGQYALAIDRYSRALEVNGQLAAAYYNRANARTRSGEYEAALADYGRALAIQPGDADALNNRGMLHVYRGDYAAAVADFDAALAIAPGDTTVLVNRGLARLHAGQAVEALADFATATGRDPHDAAAHYGTGQASAVLGEKEAALAALRRAIEIDPEYAREAAADPKLAILDGNPEFLKLLRDAGARPGTAGA